MINNPTPKPGNTTEWIVEAPCCSGSPTQPALPLADFDHVNFVNAAWTSSYVAGGTNTSYTIAQGSPTSIALQWYVFGYYQYLAAPDALNSNGASFTDYYLQPIKNTGT